MSEKDEKKKSEAKGEPAAPGKGHGPNVKTPVQVKPQPGAASASTKPAGESKSLPGEWKGVNSPAASAWKPVPEAPPPGSPGRWKLVTPPAPTPDRALAWKALSQSTVGDQGRPAPAAPEKGKPKDDKEGRRAARPEGPARAVHSGDATKADLQLTRAESDASKVRAAVAEKVAAAGVIKTPDWETPRFEGQPAPPWSPTPAVPGWGAAPATAVSEAMMGSSVKLPPARPIPPELFDPTGEFPMTADDVMIDFYPIKEPYAYVIITFNNHDKELAYRVIEPKLSPEEQKILDFCRTTMVDLLDAAPEDLKGKTFEEFLRAKFEEILVDYSIVLAETEELEEGAKGKLQYYLFRDFIGEGRIETFARDDLIEDISCDGPHQPIFIYHRKYESLKSNVKFSNDDELDSFVIRMAQRAGKHVSIAEPILDATMRDGSRLQATLSHEVSSHGSTFTIRKFRSEPFTPPDLVRFGTQSAEILAYWWIAIQHGASAIYAGGTASGKTTSLNAILLFIPYQMKIVSIEDTRELSIPHPNWIAGITRAGFGARDREGRQAGEIDMFQLLKNALRQRPEYIVVGEVRGKEAYNLFQAMATGHAAYGTMHADSVDAVIHRLESDPINIPRSLLEALDVISIQIQTRVGGKRVRRTKQVAEIVGLDPHTREILTNEVFRWQPKDDSFKFSGVSYVLERIQVEKGLTPQQMKQEIENRVEVIKYMIRHNIRNYKDCARVIASYYKDPNAVMERVRADHPWT